MSRSLSAAAIRAAQKQQTDEVWLILLSIKHASIIGGPLLLVNDMQDLRRPPSNLAPAASTWGTVNAVLKTYGTLAELTDASGSAFGYGTYTVSGLTAGTVYTSAVRVKKDATGKATRFVVCRMVNGASQIDVALDTATGEYAQTATAAAYYTHGVIDAGDAWLVYISATTQTAWSFLLFPAAGTGSLVIGNYNGNVTGTALFERPMFWPGLIGDMKHYTAFPFQVDLPAEDPDQPAVASIRVDNVDRSIVQAIRGLPSPPTVDIEVVLASQPEVLEIGFYDMTLRSVTYDSLYVEGQLSFEQIYVEPITLDMTPARFPGMF